MIHAMTIYLANIFLANYNHSSKSLPQLSKMLGMDSLGSPPEIHPLKGFCTASRNTECVSFAPIFLHCCKHSKLATSGFKLVLVHVPGFGCMFLQKRILSLHFKIRETWEVLCADRKYFILHYKE